MKVRSTDVSGRSRNDEKVVQFPRDRQDQRRKEHKHTGFDDFDDFDLPDQRPAQERRDRDADRRGKAQGTSRGKRPYRGAPISADDFEEQVAASQKAYAKVQHLMEDSTAADDVKTLARLRYMLDVFFGLLPLAEANYRKNYFYGRAAADALVSVTNTIREIGNDIHQLTDLQEQIDYICERILKPTLTALIQHLAADTMELKKQMLKSFPVAEQARVKRILDDGVRKFLYSQSVYLDEVREIMQKQLEGFLLEGGDTRTGKKK